MSAARSSYNNHPIPANGQRIEFRNGQFIIPDRPIIPFVEGDGTGRDIWKASRRVFDAAVEKAYGGKREVAWYEVYAGEKAFEMFKEWMPQDTVEAIKELNAQLAARERELNLLRQEKDAQIEELKRRIERLESSGGQKQGRD